jgi:sulfur relay (sulfurtransferase) complex TusBCD TusD component (DsrE family)
MEQEPKPKARKLGILISVAPTHASFHHGLQLAAAALTAKDEVYLYCLDDAVAGVEDQRVQTLRGHGLRLFACAYACQRRKIVPGENALYGGLTLLNDVMSATDRFVSFN